MSKVSTAPDGIWEWLTQPTPAPSIAVALAAIAAGAVIAVIPASWSRTRLLATYAHEAGHALVAVCFGRRVTSMRLEADSSGTTRHAGAASGFGRLATAFAGYPAPALAGVGLTAAACAGHAYAGIAATMVVASALALVQASWRGWMLTLLILAGMLLMAMASPVVAAIGLLALAGYLFAATPRTIIELHRWRRQTAGAGEARHSDADSLAEMTGVPAGVWEVVFMIGALACLWWAARLVLAAG